MAFAFNTEGISGGPPGQGSADHARATWKHLFGRLDVNGDFTGNANANGNYSGAVEEFYYQPAAGKVATIQRMLVFIEDSGLITADGYGALAALSNGIEVQVRNGAGVLTDLTGGDPVTSNAEWAQHCYDMQDFTFGSGNNFVVVRWTFARSGEPLILIGDNSERLAVRVNDDLTGLVDHSFTIQGLETL